MTTLDAANDKKYIIDVTTMTIFCAASDENAVTVAKWRHITTSIWLNNGLGNGVLPDGTKPLYEPVLNQEYFHPSQCNFTVKQQLSFWNIFMQLSGNSGL